MNENNNLQPVQKLTPFTKMVMSIGTLPSSFYASMSYYESMVWLYEYLKNEIIPTVNNNGEAVIEVQEKFITLQENFETLETWVHEYEEEQLPIEVQNTLDEMATDGTLENIINEVMKYKGLQVFNTVADLKASTNLANGSFVETFGYHGYKDGGGAKYKIRNKTNEDIANEMTLIALHDTSLIAELIIENSLNVKQIGAISDGTTDNTTKFQFALDYCIANNLTLIIDKGKFRLANPLHFTTSGSKIKIQGFNSDINWTALDTAHETKIIVDNGFISNSSFMEITLDLENIFFSPYNVDNNCNLFTNCKFISSHIKNIGTIEFNKVFYQCSFNVVSIVKDNFFVSCRQHFFDRNSTESCFSDSYFVHNYVNGKPGTNAICFKGNWYDTSNINDNYIDFFKYVYAPNGISSGTISYLNSFNNVYDYCYQLASYNLVYTSFSNDYFLHFNSASSSLTQFTFGESETPEYGVLVNKGIYSVCLKFENCRIKSCDKFLYFDSSHSINFKGLGNTHNKWILNNNTDITSSSTTPITLYSFDIYNEGETINMIIDNNIPTTVTSISIQPYAHQSYYNNQMFLYNGILLRYFNKKLYNTDGTEYTI